MTNRTFEQYLLAQVFREGAIGDLARDYAYVEGTGYGPLPVPIQPDSALSNLDSSEFLLSGAEMQAALNVAAKEWLWTQGRLLLRDLPQPQRNLASV